MSNSPTGSGHDAEAEFDRHRPHDRATAGPTGPGLKRLHPSLFPEIESIVSIDFAIFIIRHAWVLAVPADAQNQTPANSRREAVADGDSLIAIAGRYYNAIRNEWDFFHFGRERFGPLRLDPTTWTDHSNWWHSFTY